MTTTTTTAAHSGAGSEGTAAGPGTLTAAPAPLLHFPAQEADSSPHSRAQAGIATGARFTTLHVATVHGGRSHCMSGPGSTWKLQAWRARLGWKLTGAGLEKWREGWKLRWGLETPPPNSTPRSGAPGRRVDPHPRRRVRRAALTSTYQVMARSSYVPASSSRRRRRVAGSSLSGGRRRVIVALSSPGSSSPRPRTAVTRCRWRRPPQEKFQGHLDWSGVVEGTWLSERG